MVTTLPRTETETFLPELYASFVQLPQLKPTPAAGYLEQPGHWNQNRHKWGKKRCGWWVVVEEYGSLKALNLRDWFWEKYKVSFWNWQDETGRTAQEVATRVREWELQR